jgi:hypothetical protein
MSSNEKETVILLMADYIHLGWTSAKVQNLIVFRHIELSGYRAWCFFRQKLILKDL